MSKESIQGPLSALRNAGTVCGVCLVRGPEILVNLFPFSEARINDMVTAVDDIQAFFVRKGRSIDQMSFGYDGGCICVVEDDEFRLIVMHMLADEVDFIAKASRAFLADFQLDLFAEQIASGNTRLEGLVKGNNPPVALMEDEEETESVLDAVNRRSQGAEERGVPAEEASASEAEPLEVGDEEVAGNETEGGGDEADESGVGTTTEETGDEEEDPDFPVTGAKLSENQPESTLPPPRRPSLDRE